VLKGTILLVDDEKDITTSLKLGLERYGFVVDTFNDPETALTNFKGGTYEAVILDIRMPKLNGFELFREMKKRDSQTIFCFLTAFEIHESEFRTVFPDSGVKLFFKKPISASKLAAAFDEVLTEKIEPKPMIKWS
jgi:two-component system, OmpR family, response regulator ChvI